MARRSDADHLCVVLERGNVGAAAVAHSGAQPPHELVNHRRDAPFVCDASLDPFGYQLLASRGIRIQIELVLEIAVAAAAAHGADRSHAAILLEAAALVQNHLARAL